MDHWTSKAKQSCCGVTVHFIDSDWVLHSVPLGALLHEGGATAPELEEELFRLWLSELKAKDIKIFAATTDTAGSMSLLGQTLETLKITHVCCTDHAFSLTAKAAFGKEGDLEAVLGDDMFKSLKKARDHVALFNHSAQMLEKLKALQKEKGVTVPLGVVTEVATRWWATCAMVERIIELKSHIAQLRAEGHLDKKVDELITRDWENLENLLAVLKPFKQAQKSLEGEACVTASFVLQAVEDIHGELKKLSESNEAHGEFAQALLEDFEKRWTCSDGQKFTGAVRCGHMSRQVGTHPSLMIATFLDPRLKGMSNVADGNQKSVTGRVLELMKDLEEKRRAGNPEAEDDDDDDDDGPPLAGACNDDSGDEDSDDEESDDGVHGGPHVAEAKGRQSQKQFSCSSQQHRDICRTPEVPCGVLRKIKGESNKTSKVFIWENPLAWWRLNQCSFPSLSELARLCLAIPASSAPSERVFSIASRLITARRTNLGPEMAGKLIFVAQNWDELERKVPGGCLQVLVGSTKKLKALDINKGKTD